MVKKLILNRTGCKESFELYTNLSKNIHSSLRCGQIQMSNRSTVLVIIVTPLITHCPTQSERLCFIVFITVLDSYY